MSETLPSWLLDVTIDIDQLSPGPVRALAEAWGSTALDQLRRALLRYCMGQEDWSEEAIDCLQQRQWRAVAALARATTAHDRSVLEEDILTSWGQFRRSFDEELEAAKSSLAQMGGEGPPLEQAMQSLGAAKAEIAVLPPERVSLLDLESLNTTPLRDARAALDLLQEEIERARQAMERRREQLRGAVAEQYRETANLVQQLLQSSSPDPALVDVVLALQTRAVQALPSQDLATLTSVREELSRLNTGGLLRDIQMSPALATRQSSPPAAQSHAAGALPTGGSFRAADVSSWVQARLRGLETPGTPERLDPRETLRAVLRSYDAGELLKLSRGAIGPQAAQSLQRAGVTPASGDGTVGRVSAPSASSPMLGVLLLAPAKWLLLTGEIEDALSFFVDATRWAVSVSGEDQERAISSAVWGLFLSFVVPFLSHEERARALRPANVSALFYRPIGRWPLQRVDALGLWPELASLLSRLGDTGGVITARYLAPYLKGRPVATAELATGLILDSDGPWSAVLSILSVLFREVEEMGEIAARIDDLRSSRAPVAESRSEALDRLRRRVVPALEKSELAESVEHAAGIAMQRLSAAQAGTDESQVLGLRLVTTEVQMSPDERVVLELHRRDAVRSARALRVEVSLLDERQRAVSKAFESPVFVPRIAPNERVEVPLRFARRDDDILRGSRISVRVSRREPDGRLVPVETNLETFQIRIEPRPERAVHPKNPYVVGDAVKDRERIYGRDKEIEAICRALLGDRQDNAVLVLGERRMGKTTVLNAVVEHPAISERFADRVIRMDLQDVAMDESTATFFRYRWMEPTQRHLSSLGIRCPEISLPRLSGNPSQAFKGFMEELDDFLAARHIRVLFVLDELEKLLSIAATRPGSEQGAIGPEVIAALRAVILRSKHQGFLLAGVTDVVRPRTTQPDNRLFRLALEVQLKQLPEPDARRLLEEPTAHLYRLEAPARDMIIRETAAHPYLLQYVGREIFEHMVARHARVATRLDIEEVLTQLVQSKPDAFQHLVDAVPDATDARVVNAVGALQRGDSTVSVAAIVAQLARHGGAIGGSEVSERLLRLRARAPMVVDDSITSKQKFRLTVGLFARRIRHVEAGRSSLLVRDEVQG